jgi:hypothetical protein
LVTTVTRYFIGQKIYLVKHLIGYHGLEIVHHQFSDAQAFFLAETIPGMQAIHRLQALQ